MMSTLADCVPALESDRVGTFLRISSEEEVFAFISIDFDNVQKNPGTLLKYAGDSLLPAGFKIFVRWTPLLRQHQG